MTVLTRPAWQWAPDWHSTAGGEAADLAESVGIVLDDEQRLLLDVMLAERADGSWAAFEVAVVQGRQNGKTAALEAAVLHDLFLRSVPRIVWTAHRFRTAEDTFEDVAALCDNYDHLRRRVDRIHRTPARMSITTKAGARVDFLARTGGGGRGLTADVVVLDEALYLQSTMMGALLPTLSARPNPQVRYASSAGLVESGVLREVRNRGRRGGDPSLAYLEWGTERGGCGDGCQHTVGTAGCALDDEGLWRAANPAIGRRITLDFVRNERRALPPAEFARERLGWWEDPAEVDADVTVTDWDALADDTAVPGGQVVLAVDVSPGFASATIVACGSGRDGRPVLEVVEHAPGTSWVADRLAGLVRDHGCGPVGLDASGPAGALLPDLASAGVAFDSLAGARMAQACGAFVVAVLSGDLVHRGQRSLHDAVASARRRTVGDAAWKWSRRDSTVDISPLVAATVARHVWAERGDGQSYDLDDSIY